jgi:hypothetical protein
VVSSCSWVEARSASTPAMVAGENSSASRAILARTSARSFVVVVDHLVEQGAGHASVTITYDTYSHVIPGMMEDATSIVSALLFPRTNAKNGLPAVASGSGVEPLPRGLNRSETRGGGARLRRSPAPLRNPQRRRADRSSRRRAEVDALRGVWAQLSNKRSRPLTCAFVVSEGGLEPPRPAKDTRPST